jgi:hypothetical protein
VPPLFTEPTEPRTTALGWVEPAVHWFTESTRPEAVASRQVVNDWYREFPDPSGKFAARLRSQNDVDHHQALDELHIHHLLRQTHDDVRYEVDDVGPDFRIYENEVCIGGVEVLSLFQREDWSAEERRHRRLADEVNRRVPPTDGYFVDYEIEADKEPPPRRFADFIKNELGKLPPHDDLLRTLPDNPTRDDLPTAVYDRDGVRIRVTFIPMKKDAGAKSDPDGHIVGMGPMIGGQVNAAERLRDRVASKAGGRYDIAEVPFVVAVGVHDTLCSDDQVMQALYGGESVVIPAGTLVRRNDGVFGADKERLEGRHRRVSGVMVVNGLRAWEANAADVALYDNPYAARTTPDDLVPATRRFGPVDSDHDIVRFDWR